jgi:hypothetical protein
VPVAANAPSGVYNLHIGLYSLATGAPASLAIVQAGKSTDVTSVVIGPIKVGGPPKGVTNAHPTPQVTLNQTLGNQITLLGYDLKQSSQNCQLTIDNCQLTITLYWRADVQPSADYTVFVHLRNAAQETVRQKDSPPAGGRYPTGLWDNGEIIADEISLPLDQVPAGRYTPVVGLYNFATGDRLAVPGHPANEILLEPVDILERYLILLSCSPGFPARVGSCPTCPPAYGMTKPTTQWMPHGCSTAGHGDYFLLAIMVGNPFLFISKPCLSGYLALLH